MQKRSLWKCEVFGCCDAYSSPPLSCKAYRSFSPRGIFSQNGVGYSARSYGLLPNISTISHFAFFTPACTDEPLSHFLRQIELPAPAQACKTNIHDLTHFTICSLNPQGTFRFSVTNSPILFNIFPIFLFILNLLFISVTHWIYNWMWNRKM